MRVLVTGATGFVGKHLTTKLSSFGYTVKGVSRSTGVDLRFKNPIQGVMENFKPEIVYHLAANAAEGKSIYSPIESTENNVNVFYNTIVPAINNGLKRFIFTSSIASYGQIHSPFKESDTPQPVDIYGINKLAIERGLRTLSEVHGFDYVIARPHNIYGPGQNMKDIYRNVVTLFMNHVLMDKPYTIFGDGSMTRQFSYIDDVVDVLAKMASYPVEGGVFNVGSENSKTIQELSDNILEITGSDIKPNYLPQRVHEVFEAKADHTLQNRVFGYTDTDFKDGLKETWRWVKEQGPSKYEKTALEIDSSKAPKNWK